MSGLNLRAERISNAWYFGKLTPVRRAWERIAFRWMEALVFLKLKPSCVVDGRHHFKHDGYIMLKCTECGATEHEDAFFLPFDDDEPDEWEMEEQMMEECSSFVDDSDGKWWCEQAGTHHCDWVCPFSRHIGTAVDQQDNEATK